MLILIAMLQSKKRTSLVVNIMKEIAVLDQAGVSSFAHFVFLSELLFVSIVVRSRHCFSREYKDNILSLSMRILLIFCSVQGGEKG